MDKEKIEENNYNEEIEKLGREKFKLELQKDILHLRLEIKRLVENGGKIYEQRTS